MEIAIYFVQYILVFELKLLTQTTSIVTFTVIMILSVQLICLGYRLTCIIGVPEYSEKYGIHFI